MDEKKKKKKSTKIITNGKPDYILIIFIMLIYVIGLITLLSASAPTALAEKLDSYKYFKNQFMYSIIGIVLFMVISTIDYRVLKNKKLMILVFALAVILSIIVKFLGTEEKGAIRWISIGRFSLQPSEFVKFMMIYVSAEYFSEIKEKGKIKDPIYSVLIPFLGLGLVAVTTFKLQNHLSAALLITITVIVQMYIAGVNYRAFATTILTAIAIIGFYTMKKFGNSQGGFRQERMQVWLDPFKKIQTSGWQTSQGLYALASGGLLGVGIGNSNQKHKYIPEPQNDFIFSIFAEEMGFIGVLVIMAIFFVIIVRGIMIARNAKDLFGKLLAIGITTIIGLQICLNLAVVSNTIPVTGISLPLFSYGGSSIISIFMGLGLLISISKVNSEEERNSKKIRKSYIN